MKVLKIMKDGSIRERHVSEGVFANLKHVKNGGDHMDEDYFNEHYDKKKTKKEEITKPNDNDRRNNETNQGSGIDTGSGNPSIDPTGETLKEVKRSGGNSKGQPNKRVGRGGAKKKA